MPLVINGGSLLLSDGKLATTTDCCCTDRPPSACWCPDFCSYDIEVVSPLAVKSSPSNPCGFSPPKEQIGDSAFAVSSPPGELGEWEPGLSNSFPFRENEFDFGYSIATRSVLDLGGRTLGLNATYQDSFQASTVEEPIVCGGVAGGTRKADYSNGSSVSMEVSCRQVFSENSPDRYQIEVDLFIFIGVFVPHVPGILSGSCPAFGCTSLGSCYGIRTAWYEKKIILGEQDTSCSTTPDRTCSSDDPLIKYGHIATPLTITASLDETWEKVFDEISDRYDDTDAPSVFETLYNTTSVTFRITHRDQCVPVQCNCALNISGLKVRFAGKDFVLGTQQRIEEGNTVWEHDVQFSAQFPGGLFTFYKATYLPEDQENSIPEFGIATEQILLDMYCATDNEADPPESRWFVEASTLCQTFSGGMFGGDTTSFAQRLLIGYLRCYKGSGTEQCPGTAFAGQFIPLGDPEEIEEAEGSPFSNPEFPLCDAPGFPEFSIDQDCTS